MPPSSPFRLKQEYNVPPLAATKAYVVGSDEWDLLKGRISRLTFESDFHTGAGWALIGAAVSTGASAILVYLNPPNPSPFPSSILYLVAAAVIFFIFLVAGILCLVFAREHHALRKERASDITAQMEIVEKRFCASD